jgi:hypothetical protein
MVVSFTSQDGHTVHFLLRFQNKEIAGHCHATVPNHAHFSRKPRHVDGYDRIDQWSPRCCNLSGTIANRRPVPKALPSSSHFHDFLRTSR